ncbi:nucleotidyltransferase family protein [Rhizobium sp. L1K21]|uniref:nucleotidyltransferase family protein n=1 Tax=Rhizobium sp. L1K21 TaxID=2954933 RepID=UPI002092DFB5|nr:nucleotidyltransferase family protein [Rhizobium sp. L1K21]MCO6187982.1 nucleotidyltransferase family protein [Rhizobium sp. L1K21]
MKIEHAMVLAAGLGTRMRPITDTTPKPLVKIGGKAMIDYALDSLHHAGVETAVVNVHHLADQMLAHLAERQAPKIIISDERAALMNSGGGLAKGLKLLPSGPLFVMNADLFWVGEPNDEMSNLEKLAAFFDPKKMDMALLCVKNEHTTGHNGKLDFSLGDDGKLTRYADDHLNPVVYAGAIAMLSSFLDDAPDEAFNLNIYFDKAIKTGRLYGMELKGHWITVGTPDAIVPAEEAIQHLGLGP